MKLNVLILILTIVFQFNVIAEEAPTESPTPENNNEPKRPFEKLFETVLGETDFFVCESDITVAISKKDNPAEAVFYSKASKRGKNGALILKELHISLEVSKTKAMNECQAKFSQKDCLTRGLINNKADYTEFDFASKKAFLDTLVKNCTELSESSCKSAKASEPECYLLNLEALPSKPKEEPTAETKSSTKK